MVDLHCAPSRLLEASSSDHHHGEETLLLRHLLLQLPPPPLLLLLLMLLRNYHRRSCWEAFPSCASSPEWKTTVTVEADVVAAEVVMMTKTGEAAAVAGEVAVAEVVAAVVEEGGRSCLLLSLHHAELCSSCHQVLQGVP